MCRRLPVSWASAATRSGGANRPRDNIGTVDITALITPSAGPYGCCSSLNASMAPTVAGVGAAAYRLSGAGRARRDGVARCGHSGKLASLTVLHVAAFVTAAPSLSGLPAAGSVASMRHVMRKLDVRIDIRDSDVLATTVHRPRDADRVRAASRRPACRSTRSCRVKVTRVSAADARSVRSRNDRAPRARSC